MTRVAGTCYVKVGGDQVLVKGNVECPLTDFTREPVMSSSGPAGFKETAEMPYVKATLVRVSQADFNKVTQATDLTITVEFANGGVYTLSDGWVAGRPVFGSEEGTSEVEWNGMRGKWSKT